MGALRKVTDDKEPPLDPKQVKIQCFIDGMVEGKSMRQAALDAGYAESTADDAYRALMPRAREAFRKALHHRISVGKLSDTIAAGLKAEETKLFQKDGIVTDERNLVAWGERREYAKLAANLMDLEPNKSLAITGADGQPLQVEIKLAHFGVVADKRG